MPRKCWAVSFNDRRRNIKLDNIRNEVINILFIELLALFLLFWALILMYKRI